MRRRVVDRRRSRSTVRTRIAPQLAECQRVYFCSRSQRLDRRRREAEDEDRAARRPRATSRVRSSGTSSSSVGGCCGPKKNSITTISTVQTSQLERDEREDDGDADRDERDPRRAPAEHRVGDVAAVELADREEVQRRREQAEPGRKRHRVQVQRVAVRARDPQTSHAAALKSSGSPSASPEKSFGSAHDVRQRRCPMNSAGTATTKPASGPGDADVEQHALACGSAGGCG